MQPVQVGLGVYQSAPIVEMVRLAQHAEALGFRHIGFNDNQCGSRELFLTLGAVATATSRIRLGTAVANTVTRHLTVLAGGIRVRALRPPTPALPRRPAP